MEQEQRLIFGEVVLQAQAMPGADVEDLSRVLLRVGDNQLVSPRLVNASHLHSGFLSSSTPGAVACGSHLLSVRAQVALDDSSRTWAGVVNRGLGVGMLPFVPISVGWVVPAPARESVERRGREERRGASLSWAQRRLPRPAAVGVAGRTRGDWLPISSARTVTRPCIQRQITRRAIDRAIRSPLPP